MGASCRPSGIYEETLLFSRFLKMSFDMMWLKFLTSPLFLCGASCGVLIRARSTSRPCLWPVFLTARPSVHRSVSSLKQTQNLLLFCASSCSSTQWKTRVRCRSYHATFRMETSSINYCCFRKNQEYMYFLLDLLLW